MGWQGYLLPLLEADRLEARTVDDLETAAAQALHKLFALEGREDTGDRLRTQAN